MLPVSERIGQPRGRGRRLRVPLLRHSLAMTAAGMMGSCVAPVAPDGATLLLTVEPARTVVDTGTATVRATVFSVAGDLLDYEATVTVLLDGGGALCAEGAPDVACSRSVAELPKAVTFKTKGGVGKLTFRSGTEPDTVFIIARSGPATDTSVVYVERPASPDSLAGPE